VERRAVTVEEAERGREGGGVSRAAVAAVAKGGGAASEVAVPAEGGGAAKEVAVP